MDYQAISMMQIPHNRAETLGCVLATINARMRPTVVR
jgi:hypothetical protein